MRCVSEVERGRSRRWCMGGYDYRAGLGVELFKLGVEGGSGRRGNVFDAVS